MNAASLDRFVTQPFASFGSLPVTPALALLAAIALVLSVLVITSRSALRRERESAATREDQHMVRLDQMLHSQAEITGRMRSMADVFGGRQADLSRTLAERFDSLSARVGRSIESSGETAATTLAALGERLAVIDRAQSEIRDLAGNVVKLQDILANKQSRGAFGEACMRAIVEDMLPASCLRFQASLSNGKRPDCLVLMPNEAPALAIDAKFPLEAYSAFAEAEDSEGRRSAALRFRRDMEVHVRAVAEKYLVKGETQDTAFLFVPSETIFAALHESFDDLVQKAYRSRVVIVSPTLLVLSIQIVQSLVRDARMREEAGRIQREVALFGEDIARLQQRVGDLRIHFGKASQDIEQIVTSTGKLARRSARISAMELDEDAA